MQKKHQCRLFKLRILKPGEAPHSYSPQQSLLRWDAPRSTFNAAPSAPDINSIGNAQIPDSLTATHCLDGAMLAPFLSSELAFYNYPDHVSHILLMSSNPRVSPRERDPMVKRSPAIIRLQRETCFAN